MIPALMDRMWKWFAYLVMMSIVFITCYHIVRLSPNLALDPSQNSNALNGIEIRALEQFISDGSSEAKSEEQKSASAAPSDPVLTCMWKSAKTLSSKPIPIIRYNLTSSSVLREVGGGLKPGGKYTPEGCLSEYSMALIVPYRDRAEQVLPFLYHMHRLLKKQLVTYQIFFVEQTDDLQFNRGLLLNIGYDMARSSGRFDCITLSDVDLLPLNEKHRYDCRNTPKHMSAYINKLHKEYSVDAKHWKYFRTKYFGGVSAMTSKQFEAVNGFSNVFFGWGGEDDNLSMRLKSLNMTIHRFYKKPYHVGDLERFPGQASTIGNYFSLPHPDHTKNNTNSKRYKLLKTTRKMVQTEGLNSMKSMYELESIQLRELCTWIRVRINTPIPPPSVAPTKVPRRARRARHGRRGGSLGKPEEPS